MDRRNVGRNFRNNGRNFRNNGRKFGNNIKDFGNHEKNLGNNSKNIEKNSKNVGKEIDKDSYSDEIGELQDYFVKEEAKKLSYESKETLESTDEGKLKSIVEFDSAKLN